MNMFRKITSIFKYIIDRYYRDIFSIKRIYDLNFLESCNEKNNICVFAHYDDFDLIDSYVLDLLSVIAKSHSIVFVTTLKKLDNSHLNKLKPYSSLIIHRYNVGYDFGSWRDGIRVLSKTIPWSKIHSILLMNDSNYAVKDFSKMLDSTIKYHESGYDLVGCLDSYEHRYHLQSFFLSYSYRAFESKHLRKFYNVIKHQFRKVDYILHYELGLMKIISSNHFSYIVHFPYHTVVREYQKSLKSKIRHKRIIKNDIVIKNYVEKLETKLVRTNSDEPINPSHYFGAFLALETEYPFYKAELAYWNPLKVKYPIGFFQLNLSKINGTFVQHMNENVKRRSLNIVPDEYWFDEAFDPVYE